MKRLRHLSPIGILLALLPSTLWSADWQVGRIQQVDKNVTSKVLYYQVNTPVTEETVTYTVSVHVNRQVLTGTYESDKVQGAPPSEWTENTPVWVRLDDKVLYLKTATSSEVKLALSKTKPAPMMSPLTLPEIKAMNAGAQPSPANSTIGFGAKEAAQAEEAAAANPEAEPPGGTISISTVPYLADIFVDGKDMGYSPAKIRMSPGKHDVRVSKNGYATFSKQVIVAADSEQKLDVTLDKKP